MVKIRRSGEFLEMLRELALESQDLELITQAKIKLFEKNPRDTRLENHLLTKSMEGKWVFSITNDIRIVYEWLGKTTVRFLAIGGHGRVYKNKTT